MDLADLQPEEAILELSEKPGKQYTLKKFSLAAQIWLKNKFGDEGIKSIFQDQKMGEISEITYYLLKDKTDFKSLIDLQEAIVTTKDKLNMIAALLKTIGLSQPVIEKIAQEESEKKS